MLKWIEVLSDLIKQLCVSILIAILDPDCPGDGG
jgi:hypothetical protein